ncbi:alpha/beta fold hydrolase [Kitasatospora aburaviensis]
MAHSTAAATALRYAADHPDRVSGLVLVAPPHLRPDSAVVAKLLAPPRCGPPG